MKKITLLFICATIATMMFAQTPAFNTASGTYYNPFSVELTGSNIYYTLDGTMPTENSTKYTSAITISEFGTITTITAASFNNNTWSDAVTATYELKVAAPVFSITGGLYEKITGNDALEFTTETTGATVYYNDRGEDPKTSGSKLWGALSILSTRTINAIAFVKDANGEKIYSDMVSEYYVISPIALFVSANEVESAKYIINGGDKVAYSFYENTENGNLNTTDVTILKNKYIETNVFCGFTFTGSNGEYTIQDAYNRYIYINEGNSLCATKNRPSTGYLWNISIDSNTLQATIKNIAQNKLIAYNAQSGVFGLYSENEIGENITLPALYKGMEYPTITITPEDGDTLKSFSKFTVTCESGIEYEEPNNKTYTYFNIGYDFTKHEFDNIDQIDECTIEFTLDEPIETTEDYKIVFPAGVFTLDPDGLGKTNKEIISRYSVLNTENLELTYANPGNKETVTALQYLYFEFNQEIKMNVNEVVVSDKKGNEYTFALSSIDSWGESCPDNALCLKANEAITAAGEYTFVLKKEHISAKNNKELTIEKDITYRFSIIESLKVENVVPNNGDTYEEVSEITLTFNKDVMHENITEIIVTDINGENYTFAKTTTNEETSVLTFVSATPISATGTYSFTIEDNLIYCEATNNDMNETEAIPETTFTFTVKNHTSIESIDAEGEDTEIYDLTGRCVNEITNAGIYIISGKKKIVK